LFIGALVRFLPLPRSRVIRYYFEMDFQKMKVRSAHGSGIPRGVSERMRRLHPIIERNSGRSVNLASVNASVYDSRHGYRQNGAHMKLYRRNIQQRSPHEHEIHYTTCCGRLTGSPFYDGLGNYRTVNSVRVDQRDILSDLVNSARCRCVLFSGNVTGCPVHSTPLVNEGQLSCCMFKRNDRKKRMGKLKKMRREYFELAAEVKERGINGNANLAHVRDHLRGIHAAVMNRLTVAQIPHPPKVPEEEEMNTEDQRAIDDRNDILMMGEVSNSQIMNFQVRMDGDDEDEYDVQQDSRISNLIESEKRKTLSGLGVQKTHGRGHGNQEEEEEEEEEGESELRMDVDTNDTARKGRNRLREYVPFGNSLRFGSVRRMDRTGDDDRMSQGRKKGYTERQTNKKKKKKKKGRKPYKYSSNIYEGMTGFRFAERATQWTKGICRYQKTNKCGDRVQSRLKTIRTFGKILLTMSPGEDYSTHTWCDYCASFVEYNATLCIGDRYACESCWTRRPRMRILLLRPYR